MFALRIPGILVLTCRPKNGDISLTSPHSEECVDVAPNKKLGRPQKRKFELDEDTYDPSYQTASKDTYISRPFASPPAIQPTKLLQPAVLAALLSEIQKLGKTTVRLKAEQAAIKQELQEWNAAHHQEEEEQSPPATAEIMPLAKRQRQETIIAAALVPSMPAAMTDFIIDDPLKVFMARIC